MHKAFFLDRDGTINVDYNFVHKPEEWTWCSGVIEAIRWMNRKNYKVIIVTNQSGISRGRYSESQVDKLHNWVDGELEKHKVFIDDWYIAPYHPRFSTNGSEYDPDDRKPGTGMFLKAGEKHEIDFRQSYMAGDKISDLKPAIELGMKSFFIRSRHEPDQDRSWLEQHNIQTYDNIREVITEL